MSDTACVCKRTIRYYESKLVSIKYTTVLIVVEYRIDSFMIYFEDRATLYVVECIYNIIGGCLLFYSSRYHPYIIIHTL